MCNIRYPGQSCQCSGLAIDSSNSVEQFDFVPAVCNVSAGVIASQLQKEKAKGSNSPLGGAPAFYCGEKKPTKNQKAHTKDSTILILIMQIGTDLRKNL